MARRLSPALRNPSTRLSSRVRSGRGWRSDSSSERSTWSSLRSSVSASRPACSIVSSTSASSRSTRWAVGRAVPACTTIRLTECATMSCSSRAMTARSRATASLVAVSRSTSARSSRVARTSACAVRRWTIRPSSTVKPMKARSIETSVASYPIVRASRIALLTTRRSSHGHARRDHAATPNEMASQEKPTPSVPDSDGCSAVTARTPTRATARLRARPSRTPPPRAGWRPRAAGRRSGPAARPRTVPRPVTGSTGPRPGTTRSASVAERVGPSPRPRYSAARARPRDAKAVETSG